MDSGNEQIVYYFIEEANEHLDTLEKGLLDLEAVMADQERVNEMFRAAHSVKGGAAMLGFDSIKTIAHRLEDCFKILQEHPVNVDQKLESMFLKGYDTLKDLVKRLEGPFGLQEQEAEKTVKESEPNFAQLQAYLDRLVSGGGAASTLPVESVKTPPANFVAQVMEVLKEMLQLFKQNETPATRQQLVELCNRLSKLGGDIETWQTMVQTAHRAIANPQNAYRTLAPVAIKEIKQASELLTAGKANAIAASPTLQQLGAAPVAAAQTAAPATPKQIAVAVEPKAAAKALLQAFDKKQLSELVALLQNALR